MPMEELRTFVLYDIVDDKVRANVVEACLDFGLVRVQYSAFAGMLNRNKRQELFLCLCGALGGEAGKILVQPICEKDAARVLLHESPGTAVGGN